MGVAVRAAEPTATALIRTRLHHSQRLRRRAGLLLDHTAMLRTDMIAVMRQSAEIMQRSRHLAPRPIWGGADDAELLIGVMTAGAALCAPCIAKRIEIPHRTVEAMLLSVGRPVLIDIGDTVCDACGTANMVYRLEGA